MADQPFTDEELGLIADFSDLSVDKVRGIAWLTTLKLVGDFQGFEGFDRSGAHNDGAEHGR